ncbi:RagB/SusD family nutrient uptake outer membrane protein [Chitinophaga sp. Cy-1792]|uniref:RagB/SusD family nutrient uptake outer membrane protein n=1 Tax=Chitinophaga sp. Cy-1792 TaxID=2608339 RepID=UPI001420F800|nr:RagB/SusD family nutrient uptake outer membrane protein [Chitinophaga sp. Cy-1792]NIG54179.1 RagB/SusD family nutrient uptake outer membrane protein [Chitinophaga sp. Cy-1792]
MKRFIIAVGMAALLCISQSGCKKFLDTESPTKESGASFWKTREDVERFTNNMYGEIADVLLNNSFFLAAEFRCGVYRQTPMAQAIWNRTYFDFLVYNNMKSLQIHNYWNDYFHFDNIRKWDGYFKVIQSAGILQDRVMGVSSSEVSDTDKRRYKAEAVWVRCFLYFIMVRLYGDVPYYKDPYFAGIIGRTKFTDVLNSCIADLDAIKGDLPWAYSDPKMKAVRPSRGAAIDLMMHMNMWNAGFDEANKDKYYTATVQLGKELLENNNGAYRLLTISEFKRLFRGGSEEGLFEFTQNVNYGEVRGFGYQYLNDNVLEHSGGGYSYVNLVPKFMEKMYPLGIVDRRRDAWFDVNTMYTGGNLVEFRKFAANVGSNIAFDGNLIVFRLADAILLAAEANAELGAGNEAEATRLLNLIRARAETIPYVGAGGQDLKDAIFWERARELMGEGHAFYDLVRTHRIINSEYCTAPISPSAFLRGAWTWPIDASALTNNPLMKLNDYWL